MKCSFLGARGVGGGAARPPACLGAVRGADCAKNVGRSAGAGGGAERQREAAHGERSAWGAERVGSGARGERRGVRGERRARKVERVWLLEVL